MPPPPSELLPPPPNEQQPRKIGRSSSIEPLLVIQLPEPDMANSLNIPNATNAAVATEIHNNINPKELNVHVPPPRSTDGVFANLAAKPEIMQLPKSPYPLDAAAISDAPPPYGPVTYRTSGANAVEADSISIVELNEMEVGSYLAFAIFCIISLVFQIIGFIMGFVLSRSHASRFGSIGGLGLTIALNAPVLEDALRGSINPNWVPWLPMFTLVAACAGYTIFLYALFAFRRMRQLAEIVVAGQGYSDGTNTVASESDNVVIQY